MKERLSTFLKLQKQGIKFKDIALKLEISESTLRRFLKKEGYVSNKGIYESTDKSNTMQEQVSFENVKIKNKSSKNKKANKHIKDRKINMTQDDMDKLCEVYDWYLSVKDNKSMKVKLNKKDLDIDVNEKYSDLKSKNIKVDNEIWEEFERLCSNSQHKKVDIINKMFKDFMKEHKYLL